MLSYLTPKSKAMETPKPVFGLVFTKIFQKNYYHHGDATAIFLKNDVVRTMTPHAVQILYIGLFFNI